MSRNNTKMLGITAHFRRQDGKVDPPVPKFDRSRYTYSRDLTSRQLEHTRKVLEGDTGSLMAAFTWTRTPQGQEYWYSVQREHIGMTPEDRDYIEWLLEEYDNDELH
jgi:hypothetical protein